MARALVAGSIALVVLVTGAVSPGRAAPGDPPITGEVFRDYDADGVRDALEPDFAAYSVIAYDAAGASAAGTVATDGTFSIDVTGLGVGPFRVEFDDLPAFVRSGQDGPDSGTTVQFVDAGGTASLGVTNPAEYCDRNAELATTCFQGGSTAADGPAVVDFVYEAGTTSSTSNATVALTPHPERASDDEVGPVRGLAYHREADVIFAAAYAKRHTAYPGGVVGAPADSGPDTIYTVFRDGSAPVPFVTIEAGDDNHDYADLIDDVGFWDDVGRTGWGDIDLDEAETTLYAANQFDRLIYAIPVDASVVPPAAGTPSTVDLSSLTSVDTDCTNGSWVPGAVKAKDGLIYLSATCVGDGAGATSADLQAFVYAYDPAGGTATEVANVPLDYDRTWVSRSGSTIAGAEYLPWVAAEPTRNGSGQVLPAGGPAAPFGQSYYPQPWVTDIEFDEDGDMILGVTDRFGDQFGNDNTAAGAGNGEGVAGGDTVRLARSGATWSLTPATDDEFYGSERYTLDAATPTHEEISLGHLAVFLGRAEVVSNAFDPAPVGGPVPAPGGGSFANSFRSGGLIWMSHADGSRTRSYQVFGLDEPGTFGKASGIGDIELLCAPAPIEIGDYVWLDLDGDGIQDPDEQPLEGVTVTLYDDAGTLVATATTDANGRYTFGVSDPADATASAADDAVLLEFASDYVIRFDQSTATNVPGPYTAADLVVTQVDGSSGIGDGDDDRRDSDIVTGDVLGLGGALPEIEVTTGLAGDNDHTFDAGFELPYSIGSTVWRDDGGATVAADVDNGVFDASESPIPGVEVLLYAADASGQPVGPILDTQTTDGNGDYLFDGLAAGQYVVVIPPTEFAPGEPLENLATSTPTTGADDNDSGQNTPLSAPIQPGGIVSDLVVLGDGPEPTGEDDPLATAAGLLDDRGDGTVDFGFTPLFSLGNLVWEDNGLGAAFDNGVYDPGAGELPIPGVPVRLYAADASGAPVGTALDTTTTDANGHYLFTQLQPGDYVVVIDPAGFGAGQPLEGLTSSTGASTSYDLADDATDHGGDTPLGALADLAAGAIASAPITLGAFEPVGESDTPSMVLTGESPDAFSNLTVDFGFVERLDLALRKRPDVTDVLGVDGKFRFFVEVLNQGTVAVDPVVVTDYVQPGWDFLLADNPPGTTTPGTLGGAAGQAYTYTVGDATAAGLELVPVRIDGILPAGESVLVPIVLTADFSEVTGTPDLVNRAEISYFDDDDDPSNGDSDPTNPDNPASGPLVDVDSTPDADDTNDPEVDDIVDQQPPVDEDDADIATVPWWDLSLIKTRAAGQSPTVNVGDTVVFDITVNNQGNSTAYDVEVTDEVPAELTLDGATTDAGLPAGVTRSGGTFTIDQLDPAETVVIPVLFTVAAAPSNGTIVNGAEISAMEGDLDLDGDGNPTRQPVPDVDSVPDATPGNDAFEPGTPNGTTVVDPDDGTNVLPTDNIVNPADEDDDDTEVLFGPYDLALRKTTTATIAVPGELVTFTVEVFNQGFRNVDVIEVFDDVDPASFGPFDAALNPPTTTGPSSGDAWVAGGGTFATPATALDVTWAADGDDGVATLVGVLAPGESATFPVVLRVAAAPTADPLVNVAEISLFADGDNPAGGNSQTDPTAYPDLDSTPDRNPDDPGGAPGSPADDAIDGDGSGTPNGTDPDGDEDDRDPATLTRGVYDLALIKTTPTSSPVAPGGTIAWEVTVANQGNVDSGPVEVLDEVPAGLTIVGTPSDGGVVAGQQITWTLGNLAPGASVTLTFDTTISDPALRPFRNWAEITSDGATQLYGPDARDEDSVPNGLEPGGAIGTDPGAGVGTPPNDDAVDHDDPGFDSGDATGADVNGMTVTAPDEDDNDFEDVDVGVVYDLALIKTVESTVPVAAGDTITWVVTVANQGNVDSGPYDVTDVIPAGTSYVSTSAPVAPAEAGRVLTFADLPSLPPAGQLGFSIVTRVDSVAEAPFRNWSEISSDSAAFYGTTDEDSTPDADTGDDDGAGTGTPPNDDVDDHDDIGLDDPPGDEDDNDFAEIDVVPPPTTVPPTTVPPSTQAPTTVPPPTQGPATSTTLSVGGLPATGGGSNGLALAVASLVGGLALVVATRRRTTPRS
ncbi:MAG: SdrD B-like domain-containing protein [Ilumatobacter sp.]|uniref:SdrD B-like domain-containing protein n=1 Tax=Ilumatobacter sp. TaxID=1967498 RepID=UPI002624F029|nr:SdrD B-like domain-containing protein [Ilumatobacter sp.]MDJ0767988.1 SdrD B-like domain-containing protein [Ilumatobacter sp.]